MHLIVFLMDLCLLSLPLEIFILSFRMINIIVVPFFHPELKVTMIKNIYNTLSYVPIKMRLLLWNILVG